MYLYELVLYALPTTQLNKTPCLKLIEYTCQKLLVGNLLFKTFNRVKFSMFLALINQKPPLWSGHSLNKKIRQLSASFFDSDF